MVTALLRQPAAFALVESWVGSVAMAVYPTPLALLCPGSGQSELQGT